ncbi:MAG: response regulator transcription factor [Luteolibacter sp.]
MKRIFLVDDHPMLREGLRRLITQISDCQVCGEAATSADALEAVPRLLPDLVVMDISLPDKNGLELLKDFQCLVPDVRILVFSMHDEMLYAERVVRAGAKGYLMKGAAAEKITEAIERVLTGGHHLSERVSTHLLNCLSNNRLPGQVGQVGVERLTDRELEIFELIGRCRTTGQIADQLNISPRTVDAHRSNIKAKLGLPDAPALIREAVLWIELAGNQPV